MPDPADDPDPDVVRAATAPLARWCEELPARLGRSFDCVVRPVSPAELARGGGLDGPPQPASPASSYAVVPAWADAATLLVLRHPFHGGDAVTLAFGEVGRRVLPCCEDCVAPADDSDDEDDALDASADEVVWSVTRGFAEYRREHRPGPDEDLLGGPWLEEGWFSSADGAQQAGRRVRGDTFARIWRPWPRSSR